MFHVLCFMVNVVMALSLSLLLFFVLSFLQLDYTCTYQCPCLCNFSCFRFIVCTVNAAIIQLAA